MRYPRFNRHHLSFLCMVALWSMSFTVLGQAIPQGTSKWKVFRLDGNYAVGVTLSPRGNVVVKHGDSKSITTYNGFTKSPVTAPEESNFRAYESKTGQIWSVGNHGLTLYFRGDWSNHEVREIQQELATNQLRLLRQIPLLPAEVNHVFILLSGALLEYDATTRRIGTVKRASETQLGRFLEMQEAPDGGVWISGTYGLLKLEGPLRHLNSSTPFTEYLLPNPEIYTDVRRAYEGADGRVVSVCSSPEGNRRFIFELANGNWQFEEFARERPQQAWGGWDQSIWSFTFNSVFRLNPATPGLVQKEPASGALFDVAVETNGVFWVASSEGLVRYAPFLWRTPPLLEDLNLPVQAILLPPHPTNEVWLASSEGLHQVGGNRSSLFRWPKELEGIQPGGQFHALPDSRLIVSAGRGLLLFDLKKKSFVADHPDLAQGQLLGQFQDRTVAVKVSDSNGVITVGKFDGEKISEFLPATRSDLVSETTVFLETRNGDLWFGTPHGIAIYRTGVAEWETYGLQDGLLPERILCLAEVGDNRIWAGTIDRVFELKSRRWEPVLVSVDRVFSIQAGDDGTIWVATGSGVFRRVGESWVYLGNSEGLPGQTAYHLSRDFRNQVWVATSRGVAVYHPDADQHPPKTFKPRILQPDKPSTAEPLLVSFSGADRWEYTDSDDLLFAFRLDEGSWSEFLPQSVHSFPQVTSGEHRLEVRAMDKNGNPDPTLALLEFSVIVPWFRDPRLIGVSVLGGITILFFAGLAVNRHLQLKRSYAQVGQMVEQRTRELEKANQELLHSQKMRAIGTMAAGIAHDFNNILSIIRGSAQIIEANPHDEQKIKTRVDRIQTVVEQGTSIVNALLGLGRLKENQVTVCDAGAILEETRRLLSDRFSDRVQLQIAAAVNLPRLTCSKEVVQQMLINLILNAVDAIGGKGTVTLRAERAFPGKTEYVLEPASATEYLKLAVEDSGSGIPRENLPRIFEPFFTTKAFSSRRGTGLGLSMVYELAKAMGYGLSVQSSPNTGSVFSIILPVDQSPGA